MFSTTCVFHCCVFTSVCSHYRVFHYYVPTTVFSQPCFSPPRLLLNYPAGELDGLLVEGLGLGEYRLWPLWVWIYCIIWWFIQDFCKVMMIKLIVKYDIFGYVSGAMINVREVTELEGEGVDSLARRSVGMVEGKLLNMKVGRVGARDVGGPAGWRCRNNICSLIFCNVC